MDYNDFNGNPYDIVEKAKEHMRMRKKNEREKSLNLKRKKIVGEGLLEKGDNSDN